MRDGLNGFRASQLAGAVNVPPTAEGLRAARDALAAGGKVRLDGASGLIEFDETGDRIAQLYTVWQPRT